MSIRVLVVDDQTVVRQALEVMVGLEADIDVVGSAADGEQAVAAASELHPDVILMDVNMPVLDGVAATARILEQCPGTRVIILTTFDDDASILGGMRAGASGYLTKEADRNTLAQAIRSAHAGHAVVEPRVQQRLIDMVARDAGRGEVQGSGPEATGSGDIALTPREREILELISEGLRNKEIAAALVVSEATVKTHINNLFAKLGLRSRAEAVRYVLAGRSQG